MDADGDLVTGATGLDSEVSKDGGTFADATSEATEIATSSGVYYLDLTSTEMNADTVAIIVKTSSVGAKTTTLVMYPEEAGDIRVNVTQFGSSNGTFASGRPEVNTTHIAGSAVSTSSAQIGVNVVNAGGTAWGSGAITAASIASGALTSAKFAAGALDAVWSTATRLLTAGTNIVLAKGTGVTGFNDLDAAGVRSAVGLASANLDTQLSGINSKTTNLPSDPADASDIAASFGTVNATLSTISGYIDTEVAAIKAKTDQLAFSTANRVDAQVFGMEANTVTASAVATDAVTEINTAPLAAIAALENISAAQVNAEVVDALAFDTYAEPGQGTPAATASLKDKIGYLYKAWRNRTTQTNSDYRLFADNGTTVDQTAATTDDGTTFNRASITSGP